MLKGPVSFLCSQLDRQMTWISIYKAERSAHLRVFCMAVPKAQKSVIQGPMSLSQNSRFLNLMNAKRIALKDLFGGENSATVMTLVGPLWQARVMSGELPCRATHRRIFDPHRFLNKERSSQKCGDLDGGFSDLEKMIPAPDSSAPSFVLDDKHRILEQKESSHQSRLNILLVKRYFIANGSNNNYAFGTKQDMTEISQEAYTTAPILFSGLK
ncbi:hypothetical protein Tco_0884832 [Tanacetum coccineum]